jgi:hypothetical protein
LVETKGSNADPISKAGADYQIQKAGSDNKIKKAGSDYQSSQAGSDYADGEGEIIFKFEGIICLVIFVKGNSGWEQTPPESDPLGIYEIC